MTTPDPAPTPRTTAPTREIGYVNQAAAGWYDVDLESTPELAWPLSLAVFDRMRRQDSQCISVLRAVTLPIRRTQFRLDQADASAEVTAHVANDLGLPIAGGEPFTPVRSRDRFSWSEHLRLALLKLVFGHMFFEQQYRIDDDGLARLRKLAVRMPRSISKIHVATDGGLVSIEQWGGDKPIPVNRLVAYVNDREGGNWLGTSLLRPAYKNWLIKDRVLRTWSQSIDRNGMGIPRYTGPENPAADDLDKGLEMAKAARSGDNSGVAIPNGALFDLVGVKGELVDAEKNVRYQDEQIARAVLAHFLNLGTQTGSWALGSTFAEFFTLALQSTATEICDVAQAHVVEDIVDLNYGPGTPAPRLIFDEIGSRRDATADAIKTLIDAGAVFPDRQLEEFVRHAYGLPAKPVALPPTPEAA